MQAGPPLEEMVLDIKKVKDLANRVVDKVAYGVWIMIEGRNRWENNGPHLRQFNGVFQMSQVKGRLAHHQDQPFSLL